MSSFSSNYSSVGSYRVTGYRVSYNFFNYSSSFSSNYRVRVSCGSFLVGAGNHSYAEKNSERQNQFFHFLRTLK